MSVVRAPLVHTFRFDAVIRAPLDKGVVDGPLFHGDARDDGGTETVEDVVETVTRDRQAVIA